MRDPATVMKDATAALRMILADLDAVRGCATLDEVEMVEDAAATLEELLCEIQAREEKEGRSIIRDNEGGAL